MAEQESQAAQPERTSEGVASRVPIGDLVRYYLRLGTLGFGGPVALCGQMEKELVGERKWLTRDEMREAIAVCQSMPGPLAIQVGIFISYLRGGFTFVEHEELPLKMTKGAGRSEVRLQWSDGPSGPVRMRSYLITTRRYFGGEASPRDSS